MAVWEGGLEGIVEWGLMDTVTLRDSMEAEHVASKMEDKRPESG